MLTQERAKELLHYDNGKLYWKVTRPGKIKAGAPVGCDHCAGYRQVMIDRKRYLSHRVVFLLHHGYIPKCLDHINGDKSDNRIENLREATIGENQYNRQANTNNTSGIKGVTWHTRNKRWQAQINVNSKPVYLGQFKSIEEAGEVVRRAREQLHGEFCNHGYYYQEAGASPMGGGCE